MRLNELWPKPRILLLQLSSVAWVFSRKFVTGHLVLLPTPINCVIAQGTKQPSESNCHVVFIPISPTVFIL